MEPRFRSKNRSLSYREWLSHQGWEILKRIYRHSIRLRTSLPLLPGLFLPKEQMLNTALAFVEFNRIRGDYLEFGTCEGNAFITADHFADAHKLFEMRFYAFDSFQGLPDFTHEIDQDPDVELQYWPGDFSCSLEKFQRTLRRYGVSLSRVHIIPGFFRDSLTPLTKQGLPIQAAAVVLIDCDLYESTSQVLDFITEYLINGSDLIFDDWYNFKGDPRRGERRAFEEWLDRNPTFRATEYHRYAWHGLSFILHTFDPHSKPLGASG